MGVGFEGVKGERVSPRGVSGRETEGRGKD